MKKILIAALCTFSIAVGCFALPPAPAADKAYAVEFAQSGEAVRSARKAIRAAKTPAQKTAAIKALEKAVAHRQSLRLKKHTYKAGAKPVVKKSVIKKTPVVKKPAMKLPSKPAAKPVAKKAGK